MRACIFHRDALRHMSPLDTFEWQKKLGGTKDVFKKKIDYYCF